SKIIAATEVTGPTDEFFLLEKELVSGLLDELKIDVSARSQARIGRVQTESFAAFQAWSAGIEALDAGSVERAANKLSEAMSHDARFGAAETALADLKGRLAQLEDRRSILYDDETKRIMKELKGIASTGDWAELQKITAPLIVQINNIPNAQRRAIDRAILDLKPPEGLPISPNSTVATSVTEWATFDLVMASFDDGRRADVLTWGELFVKRYPTSIYNRTVRSRVDDMIQHIAKEKAGLKSTKQVVELAWHDSHWTPCSTGPQRSERAQACERFVMRSERAGLADKGDLAGWVRVADDARDDDQLVKAAAWARAHHFDDQADKADRRRVYLSKAIARYKAMDMAAEVQAAEDGDDFRLLASRAWDARDEAEAWQVYEKGHDLYPGHLKLWEEAWDHAGDVLDLKRAERYVAGAKAAGHSARDGEAVIETIERDRKELAAVPAEFLKHLAHGYLKANLHTKAYETWMQLAERSPEFEDCDQPCALNYAAFATVASMTPGQHERMRALYQRVVDEHPDTKHAQLAQSMLAARPK
ncbi:MAG: hypothetical protein ACI9MC_001955, partial [Kiritimatiellia bacterium]